MKYNSGDYIEDVSDILSDMKESAEIIESQLAFGIKLLTNLKAPPRIGYVSFRLPTADIRRRRFWLNDVLEVIENNAVIGHVRIIRDYHTTQFMFDICGKRVYTPVVDNYDRESVIDIINLVLERSYGLKLNLEMF